MMFDMAIYNASLVTAVSARPAPMATPIWYESMVPLEIQDGGCKPSPLMMLSISRDGEVGHFYCDVARLMK